jgi:hypothetical protein
VDYYRDVQPIFEWSCVACHTQQWERPAGDLVLDDADRANARGANRRFVVTNRPGAVVLLGPTYDEYVARGESENRNKEFKCDLAMDRLSNHRFVANHFRLYLHAAAMNLLARPVRSCPSGRLLQGLGAAPGEDNRVALSQ